MLKLKSNTYKELIHKRLDELLPKNESPVKELFSAARYSLLGEGKRLRPLIVLATTETLQGDQSAALDPACALEMVHTYSLIHDDLPAMDNDDFRRGKPTLHKVFPEAHAILAGDFLLNFAFETLSQSPHLSSDQKIGLIQTLAKAGGAEGMIGGQIMDLEASGKSLTLDEVQRIHLGKTSSLLQAAFIFGGIIAKASLKEIEILRNFGEKVGLIFQIIDDVLDVTAGEEKHGRSSDKQNKKTTYASLLGVDQALRLANKLHLEALSTLSTLPYDTSLLAEIAEKMIKRKS